MCARRLQVRLPELADVGPSLGAGNFRPGWGGPVLAHQPVIDGLDAGQIDFAGFLVVFHDEFLTVAVVDAHPVMSICSSGPLE